MRKIIIMTQTALAAADDWFEKLDKKKQAEYIKAHPNSKYAKNAKKPRGPVKKKIDPKAEKRFR